jgi:Holliday junction resolvase RusA-like endonuclease
MESRWLYMEICRVEIPLKLPSCNDYILACRTNKYVGAKMKSDIESNIMCYIQNLPKFDCPVEIDFHWVEGNKRRDLDGIAFGKKFILDALVKAQKLKDDNRRCVTAFRDTFSYDKESKVILTIKEIRK